MISIDVIARQRAQFIRNILCAWHSATTEQERRGRAWYPAAHELAATLTGGDVRIGAGVIAALSANKSWEQNLRLARLAFSGELTGGHFRDALVKTAAILRGADPADVLPMRLKSNFFRCIANPADGHAVVIDRHAHDVAVGRVFGNGDRGLTAPSRYELLADCYRRAARELGELPSTVQAVTWVTQTDRSAGTRHRRPLPLAWPPVQTASHRPVTV